LLEQLLQPQEHVSSTDNVLVACVIVCLKVWLYSGSINKIHPPPEAVPFDLVGIERTLRNNYACLGVPVVSGKIGLAGREKGF
jgi:hypothetical protein